jgi:hypothetical protein
VLTVRGPNVVFIGWTDSKVRPFGKLSAVRAPIAKIIEQRREEGGLER